MYFIYFEIDKNIRRVIVLYFVFEYVIMDI